jgi:cytochrome c oxidase subunit 2
MDMIPGMNNYLWTTILKPGVYEGACSEFCGQQHAWMRIRVVAEDSAAFSNWLAGQAIAADSTRVPENAGAALFAEASCSSCHNIKGTRSDGMQGPDLTHFASRQTMLAGMLPNNAENLKRWLSDPQLVKPGAKMPRFIFGEDSIRALVKYLEKLK